MADELLYDFMSVPKEAKDEADAQDKPSFDQNFIKEEEDEEDAEEYNS